MINKRGQLINTKVMGRLLRYAYPHWRSFFLVFGLILLMTITSLAQPRLVQWIIDNHLVNLSPGMEEGAVRQELFQIGIIALTYLGTVLINFGSNYAHFWVLNKTGQTILLNLRQEVYDHVMSLSMSFFDTNPLGNLVTRITNDTENLNEMFTSVLTSLFQNIVSIIGIILIMLTMNFRLGLMVLALTPAILIISFVFRNIIQKVYEEQRRILSKINNHLSENLSGMNVIQMFHQEEKVYQEFDKADRDYLRESQREVKYFATYRPAVELIRSLGIALLLWYGGGGFIRETITFGILYAYIEYIQRFFHPILSLAETYNVIQSALTSSRRIFSLMDEKRTVINQTDPIQVDRLMGKVEFDHVWFAYKGEEWVLKDVSFIIEPGEFVAFVGSTGAGKSSIMHLISRFYDIQRGSIRIDGIDIKNFDEQQLRQAVGVVQQDVFLFGGTVEENITLGREYVSRDDAIQASKLVNAETFIRRLPGGYEAPVMERGATFSAGQRQLLSYARTVAADPSMLILDEATANIDTETELLIQDAIIKMSRNRTTIAVAHRISTIADADKIIVMHHGEIAEEGTKDQLLEQDGIFRVLYELQFDR
ncbi:ABC transporter ATP-binding protein [Alkalibacter rhizosphaerae]|uniref:ABC transporter ATP-binding protein n=1 Tax=Alkalibacter rhizosphaerae TaxID=2815577 RepID=A0A974XF41_9FIRM|nr:ABC transporter ATP-binding protein [Alkalibacter rhizosphaerae]QSX08541.1 ABC transporter ATP-binding protein [Alkalibacter rhizosphaerae]